MKSPLLLVVVVLASTGLAGCFQDLADIATDVAGSHCQGKKSQHAGSVYLGAPRSESFTVHGPGAVLLSGMIEAVPIAEASIVVYGPDDQIYWSLVAGIGSGGATGSGGTSNPPLGDYTIHAEALPAADIALDVTVFSCQ